MQNLPLSSSSRQEQRRGRGGGALLAPAVQGSGAAREEGKRERRVRGFDSPPWLGLGWSEKAAPQWPAGGGAYGGRDGAGL